MNRETVMCDIAAALNVGVVSVPLALAIAVACKLQPLVALNTAVVSGIGGALFGGTRFGITGPAAGTLMLVRDNVDRFGAEIGVFWPTFIAGLLQIVCGATRLARIAQFVPVPVVCGFTIGIGLMIMFDQMQNIRSFEVC